MQTQSSYVIPFKLMANIKLWRCSFAGRPSSGLNLGIHISGCLRRGCNGQVIWIAPMLFHGLFSIMGVLGTEEVVDEVEVVGYWVVEELAPIVLLIIIVLVDCSRWMWMEGIKGW